MATKLRALVKATGCRQEADEDRQEYLEKLVKVVLELPEDDWADLPDEDQDWVDAAVLAIKTKKPIVDPDGKVSPSEDEEEEEEAPKAKKAKAKKAVKDEDEEEEEEAPKAKATAKKAVKDEDEEEEEEAPKAKATAKKAVKDEDEDEEEEEEAPKAKATAKKPGAAKTITRVQAACGVLASLKKAATMADLAERTNAAYVKAGGQDNLKQSRHVVDLALSAAVAFEKVTWDGEKVKPIL